MNALLLCMCMLQVSKLFPSMGMPVGEEMDHPGDFNSYRVTSEVRHTAMHAAHSWPAALIQLWRRSLLQEKRYLDRLNNADMYQDLREAAEVHRHVSSVQSQWKR